MISRKAVICERSFLVEGGAFEHAGHVSTEVKALLHGIKAADDVIRRAAIVTYEAEMNMCAYADRGSIELLVTAGAGNHREATDEGQGIADIDLAMQGVFLRPRRTITSVFFVGLGPGGAEQHEELFGFFSNRFRVRQRHPFENGHTNAQEVGIIAAGCNYSGLRCPLCGQSHRPASRTAPSLPFKKRKIRRGKQLWQNNAFVEILFENPE